MTQKPILIKRPFPGIKPNRKAVKMLLDNGEIRRAKNPCTINSTFRNFGDINLFSRNYYSAN